MWFISVRVKHGGHRVLFLNQVATKCPTFFTFVALELGNTLYISLVRLWACCKLRLTADRTTFDNMATHHSSRRSRKLRRRFSSTGTAWSIGSVKSLESAPSPIRIQSRKTSLSPSTSTRNPAHHIYHRPYLTDGSDFEDYLAVDINGRRTRGRSTSPTRSIFAQRSRPTAYASLPPTPIQPSRPFSPLSPVSPLPASPTYEAASSQPEPYNVPFSLWDYLREELLATDFDSHQELKWERVSNFLQMPVAMEKVCRRISCIHSIYLIMSADYWLRFHSLFWFFFVHFHHPSYPIRASSLSLHHKYMAEICTSSPSVAESRPPKSLALGCCPSDPQSTYRRE